MSDKVTQAFLHQLSVTQGTEENPLAGLEEAINITHSINAHSWDIPDCTGVRETLTRWNIPFDEHGRPICTMVCKRNTLRILVPPGWTRENRGGHNSIHDHTGQERLHWYVHPWEGVTYVRRTDSKEES